MKDNRYKERRIVVGIPRELDDGELETDIIGMGFTPLPSKNLDPDFCGRIYRFARTVNGTRAIVIYHGQRYLNDPWETRSAYSSNSIRCQFVVKIEGLTSARGREERKLYREQKNIALEIGKRYHGVVYDETRNKIIGEGIKKMTVKSGIVKKTEGKPDLPREGMDADEKKEWFLAMQRVNRKKRMSFIKHPKN